MKNKFPSDPFRLWFLLLIPGVILTGLGILVLLTPVKSFITLSFLFSVSFIATGILEIIHAISNRRDMSHWGWLVGGGVFDLMIGILLISHPGISLIVLPVYIGFGIMFRSIMVIGWSINLKTLGEENWAWLLSTGVIGLLFSFLLLWNPVFGGLTIAVCAGFSLILVGAAQVFLSIRLMKISGYLRSGLQAR
jgi:uncharacterized membrane protein HdeD (DUF308 family)